MGKRNKKGRKKALREHNQAGTARAPRPLVRVAIEIEINIEALTAALKAFLRKALAVFLGIPAKYLRILRIRKGSTIVTVELPEEFGERLLAAHRRNDPQLAEHVAPLVILDIRPEAPDRKQSSFPDGVPSPKLDLEREDTPMKYDWWKHRRYWSQVNLMTQETIRYGDQWREALERIARKRAKRGECPKEFPFHDTESQESEENVRKVIASKIIAKADDIQTRPVVVLVGGGGAAGKTVFTKALVKYLKQQREAYSVERLDLDRYFLPLELIGDRANDGKYDNPMNSDLQRARQNIQAIRQRKDLTIPVHDRNRHALAAQTFEDGTRLRNASVVIVEGLYTLGPTLQDLADIRIYIDASQTDRAMGRVWRDINVRKRAKEHVIEMLLGRETYHQTFVEPTQVVADYIVRRAPTGGELRVVYDEEIDECMKGACKDSGLTGQQAKRALERFRTCLDQKDGERAHRTEF